MTKNRIRGFNLRAVRSWEDEFKHWGDIFKFRIAKVHSLHCREQSGRETGVKAKEIGRKSMC